MAQRKPTVGGDSGNWGEILNDYLDVSHNADGTLSPSAVTNAGALSSNNNLNDVADTTTARTNLSAAQDLVSTAVKTSAYTASPGNFVPVDASGGNVTVTLPTAPANKTRIGIKMINVSGSYTTTITAGSADVFNRAGGPTSLTLSSINQSALLQYTSSTKIWYVQTGDSPSDTLETTAAAAATYQRKGASTVEFDPSLYGVKQDGVTDDTMAWLTLIAALPSDGALIRLHGKSLISNPHGLSYSLGFNTSNLTIIGDGHETGFILAAGSNCDVLRFNTSGNNTGSSRLNRIHLERFFVEQNGYQQADPSYGIVGAIVVYAVDQLSISNVCVYHARSVAIGAEACRDVSIDHPYIDTVVPGGAANGINGVASATAKSSFIKICGGHFIDIPDKAIDIGGYGADDVLASGNTTEARNMRPLPAGVSGNPFIGFQPDGVAAAAWLNTTDYALGSFVSFGGFNYVARQASGPDNGGVVTPGTDQTTWWLQNAPLAWDPSTNYIVGQTVTYTAPTGSSDRVEGGVTLNYTCLVANSNTPPVTGGVVSADWQIGGPLFCISSSCSGLAGELTPTPRACNMNFTGNTIRGTNYAGEYVIQIGIDANTSKTTPGIAGQGVGITGNTIRGVAGIAIAANDENINVTGNEIDDCTDGIWYGTSLPYSQRNHVISSNTIRLGGLGGGIGILGYKSISGYVLGQSQIGVNTIDGGMGPTMQLSSTLASGNDYTSISVNNVPRALPVGTIIYIGPLPLGSATAQTVTLSAPAALGDTSITVNSFTAATTFNTGSTDLTVVVTTITSALSSGVPVSTLAVTALTAPLQARTQLTIPNSTGSSPIKITTTADVAVGTTTIPIQTITPTQNYSIGQVVGVWGSTGVYLEGTLSHINIANVHVASFASNGYVVTAGSGTPTAIDLVNCWAYECGQGIYVGNTVAGVRLLGGGISACVSNYSLSGSGANYVLRRNVIGINPGGSIAPPAVPDTDVNVTNQTGFDCTVYVTGGTLTAISVNGAATGMTSGPVRVMAGQTISWTGSLAPTWTWFGD